jgi:hypothetical protein
MTDAKAKAKPVHSGKKLLAHWKRWQKTPEAFVALLEERGDGLSGQALLYIAPPDEYFEPSVLEGEDGVSESRLERLFAGARPTKKELALWHAIHREGVIEDGGEGWQPAMLWEVQADDGVTLWGVIFPEDKGTWAEVFGPFPSPSAALEDLRTRGEMLEEDWPED